MSEKEQELNGVAGFATKEIIESLGGSGKENVEIRLEAGSDKVKFLISPQDVLEVIQGSDSGDEKFIQVILKPGTHISTHVEMLRDVKNLEDPALARLTATAVSTVSSAAAKS